KPEKAPGHLDWDLWTGTAPVRPYAPHIYHPAKWRSWLDFGTGWSGDIGCHVFDATWKALGLTAPRTVSARVQESWKQSEIRRGDTWPQSDHITWVFPGTSMTEKDEITVEWFDGLFYPPEEVQALVPTKPYPHESAMVIGTEGAIILPNGGMPTLLPPEKFKSIKAPKLEPRDHYHHFCDAIHGEAKNESYFEQTGPMTEAILLGTVAIRTPDTLLKWNPDRMEIPNNSAANSLLSRQYRKGWSVAGF
ncbi:MAG: gfo/Idh/MocA family oxidoreductase, partial [Verrucomicrobiota bacterium]|nr:gfo/Idh/MocA family oxidoreductase [Verrucomicrobiota bacterium]